MVREMTFYFLTLILTVAVIDNVLPELLDSHENVRTITKTIDRTRIIKRERSGKYKKTLDETFAITATDGYEIYLSKANAKNWDSLINCQLKGKQVSVKLRVSHSDNGNLNPQELRIGKQKVFESGQSDQSIYAIILLTIFCIGYSLFLIKKRLNKPPELP